MNEQVFFNKLKYKSVTLEKIIKSIRANRHIGMVDISEDFVVYDENGTILLFKKGMLATPLFIQEITDKFGPFEEDI